MCRRNLNFPSAATLSSHLRRRLFSSSHHLAQPLLRTSSCYPERYWRSLFITRVPDIVASERIASNVVALRLLPLQGSLHARHQIDIIPDSDEFVYCSSLTQPMALPV